MSWRNWRNVEVILVSSMVGVCDVVMFVAEQAYCLVRAVLGGCGFETVLNIRFL